MEQRKVLFPFEHGAESMWADYLGLNRYRLDNVPLFAYGINYGDHFTTRAEGDGLLFDRVLKRTGASTYRVTFNEGFSRDSAARLLIGEAKSRASQTSEYGDDHFALSVENSGDREAVERLLEQGEERGFWDWEISGSSR
ncbi:MAG TPA: DUF4265 domain-containing protein [Candidatus Elarobacter sp.]